MTTPDREPAHEPHEPYAPHEPQESLAPIENSAPEAPKAPIETSTTTDRSSVVVRPGVFLTAVIASVVMAGAVIYWLLRSMRI